MKSIVEAKFKIKLGSVEVEVSKEEAEALYSALFAALNKSIVNWNLIPHTVIIKEYPTYNPPVRWEPYTVVCDKSSATWYSADNVSVRSVL